MYRLLFIFKSIWHKRKIYFRILNTPLSRSKAQQTGFDISRVISEDPQIQHGTLLKKCQELGIELLLSKESGESGLMQPKLEVAKLLNIPLWIIRRPKLPEFDYAVSSEKELLQTNISLTKNGSQE